MSDAALKLPEPAQDEPRARPWRTDPDFFKVHERIRGVEMMSPRPAPSHALVASALGATLMPLYHFGRGGGPGGWLILDEPELHLGDEELVPDLAGWRRERLPTLPTEAYFSTAPDWVCEVLSPRTEKTDRAEKLDIYGEHGVQHVWLASPLLRILEVYRLDPAARYVRVKTYRDRHLVSPEPFDALPIDLGLIWPE